MRLLLVPLALAIAACGGPMHHRRVSLPTGASAAAIPRWSVAGVAALRDGRAVVAASYSTDGGDDEEWMQRGTGHVVAAMSTSGTIDWILGAPSSMQYPHRIAAATDGGVWILARTVGPFVDVRSKKIVPTSDHTSLVRTNDTGHVEAELDMSSVGITEAVYPVCVTALADRSVVAVLGSPSALYIARIANGTLTYMRRLARGTTSDLAPTLPVYCTSHGDTMWLAGAGTSLYVDTGVKLDVEARALGSDGTYHGPMVLELALATAEPHIYPLEPIHIPGGWKYPSGIAVVGDQLVLARRAADSSTVTAHALTAFETQREIYKVTDAEITHVANDGDTHALLVVRQSQHATIRYGDRTVSTSTAPPTSDAVVAVRIPVFSAGPPVALAVAKSSDASGAGIGGGVGGSLAVATTAATFLVGTFTGLLHIDERAPLHGVYGHEDRCTHEDYVRQPDCDAVFWETQSAFVIRVPNGPR